MNPRSLKFQLIAWYVVLLTVCFGVLGVASYFALNSSLVNALTDSQMRRARQVSQLVADIFSKGTEKQLAEAIESRYAPAVNGRFVRVSRKNGESIYLSAEPADHSFEPSTVPPPAWPGGVEGSNQLQLGSGHKLLVAAHRLQMPGGEAYLIEAGAPMESIQVELRKWVGSLAWMLPVVAIVALGGGYVLVRRALAPVDEIAASAQQISSRNLSERLPVPNTGDELERLSRALNLMIERLEAAFQHSRRFVADASHELRTPLTVLRGEIEGCVQDPALGEECRVRLGSALEEVERLALIVEGLFAISRLDAGEAQSKWARFDFAELVSATSEQMSLLAEDKDIKVCGEFTSGLVIEGDKSRMKQVVVNLLDNAFKYTPRGGEVKLTVGRKDTHAVLEVADTGIGIPQNALPRVFDRFFRVDDARSRELGGAGLGLSIVKSICSAHNGRVDVTSKEGKGSCFRVELPLVLPATLNHKEKT
jgi:heavy metal sensor kinase